MDIDKITKEDFESYEDVRSNGDWNMFDHNDRRIEGLSEEFYCVIMEHYKELW